MSRNTTTNFETLYKQCCRPMIFTFSLIRKQITSWETQCVDRTSGMGKSDGFWAACASHSSSLSEPGAHFSFFLLPLPLFGWAGEEEDAKNRRRETDLFFLSPVERTNDPSLTYDGAGKWWSSSHPAQFSLARFDLGSKELKRPSYSQTQGFVFDFIKDQSLSINFVAFGAEPG